MVRLTCADNPRFVLSDVEIRRGTPSYTVDTLQELRARVDNTAGNTSELWFILGSDALADLPRWRAAAQVIELARLAVVTRPGALPDLDTLEEKLPGIRSRVQLIDVPQLAISSTDLRQRIASGQPVRYQMPDSVLDYIQQHNLYQTTQA
jgi:nicotinate-nucleotide adenylyltransferase